MILWLDDIRKPWEHGHASNTEWAKTPDEAISILKTGRVTFASLDFDMNEDQMFGTYRPGEKTGLDVVAWLQQNPQYWPVDGVKVHSANKMGRPIMEAAIRGHYGQ